MAPSSAALDLTNMPYAREKEVGASNAGACGRLRPGPAVRCVDAQVRFQARALWVVRSTRNSGGRRRFIAGTSISSLRAQRKKMSVVTTIR
jgi:hypothetical protein